MSANCSLKPLISSLCSIYWVYYIKWAPSSEFVSLSIPSWQILTAHAHPFIEAGDLAFCLKVPLDSLLVWASSGGSGETARMCRLAWTFAARICNKYQIRLTRSHDSVARLNQALPIKLKCFSEQNIKEEKSPEYKFNLLIYFQVKGHITPTRFPKVWHSSIKYYVRYNA